MLLRRLTGDVKMLSGEVDRYLHRVHSRDFKHKDQKFQKKGMAGVKMILNDNI